MSPWRSRLTFRVLLILALSVILPAVLLFVLGASLSDAALRKVVDEQAGLALDEAERRLADLFYGMLELSARMADDDEIRRTLAERDDEVRRTRALDRAVSALLLFFERREDMRFTIVDPRGRLFTNWSRNLQDYSALAALPLVRRAEAESGHAVWEGFSPSFIKEEGRAGIRRVSVARTFPDFEAEGGKAPLLVLSISDEAVGRILAEGGLGARSVALLAGGSGEAFARGGRWPAAEAERKELERRLVGAEAPGASLEIASRRYLVFGRELRRLPQELKDSGWRIVAAYEHAALGSGYPLLRNRLLLAAGLLVAAAVAFSLAISRVVVRPVVELARRMEGWRLEDGLGESPSRRADEIGSLERAFLGLGAKARELFEASRREHEIRERYRLQALRGRLNPHFLFNSLNTVRFMAIIRKADNIVEALDAVSTMLRYAMAKEGETTELGEELENLGSYLFIQNARFGGRFALSTDCPEGLLTARIPRFILQPAVENCVVHGYREAFGSGEIRIEAEESGGFLRISVGDAGRGMSAERLAAIFRTPAAGQAEGEGGIGLRIVREMVKASCGEAYDVVVESAEGRGTKVTYLLPPRGEARP